MIHFLTLSHFKLKLQIDLFRQQSHFELSNHKSTGNVPVLCLFPSHLCPSLHSLLCQDQYIFNYVESWMKELMQLKQISLRCYILDSVVVCTQLFLWIYLQPTFLHCMY